MSSYEESDQTCAQSPQLVAVAHNIRSLHNVGAIFRTADAAGFTSVILSGYTGCPPDPRIAKVALGAEETLPSVHYADLDELLLALSDHWVILMEQLPSSTPPAQTSLPATGIPIALVACSEVTGAHPRLIARADAVMEIPMRGSKESLNVSVAFGIAAYSIADRLLAYTQDTMRSRLFDSERSIRPGVLTGDPYDPSTVSFPE